MMSRTKEEVVHPSSFTMQVADPPSLGILITIAVTVRTNYSGGNILYGRRCVWIPRLQVKR
jgi:hypothetical protein